MQGKTQAAKRFFTNVTFYRVPLYDQVSVKSSFKTTPNFEDREHEFGPADFLTLPVSGHIIQNLEFQPNTLCVTSIYSYDHDATANATLSTSN